MEYRTVQEPMKHRSQGNLAMSNIDNIDIYGEFCCDAEAFVKKI